MSQSAERTAAACFASAAAELATNAALIALIENHQRKQAEIFARLDALTKENPDA